MDEASRAGIVRHAILGSAWHVETLRAVRAIGLPDWAIGAGFVRNAVWDRLHGFTEPTPVPDIDVLLFDRADTSTARERMLEATLASALAGRPWSVRNQARMHVRNGDRPYTSTAHAMMYWLETPTAVAVRLEHGDALSIIAPFGLGDLVSMRVAPTPRGRERLDRYRERMLEKDWRRTWPRVVVEALDQKVP